jgi:hypothetical protein
MKPKISSSSLQIIGKCFGFFIVVAVSTHWFFSGRDEPQIKSNGVPVYAGDHAPALMVNPVGNSISSQGVANYFEPSSSESIDNANNMYQLTPEEKLEAEAWFAAKGQIGKVNSEYITYGIETLEKLVKDGDVNAIVPLGFAYLRRSGPEVALQFYLDMAAHGYTHVFSEIARLETAYKYEKAVAAEEKLVSAFEVLANYNVAKLRGDSWPYIIGADFFVSRYNIQLSVEDKLKIESRSQEIYEQIQQKRTALGLGAFDNSVPQSVKKYFDRMEYYLNESIKK